eukprot:1734152-Prymnesium_polylepis.2
MGRRWAVGPESDLDRSRCALCVCAVCRYAMTTFMTMTVLCHDQCLTRIVVRVVVTRARSSVA